MANAAAARPGTALGKTANDGSITGAVITSKASLQDNSDNVHGDVFLIKTTSATFNYSVAVVETTGSGTLAPRSTTGTRFSVTSS